MLLLLFIHTLLLCHLLLFGRLIFSIPPGRVSNSLDPDQARYLSGLIWVQIACKGYQREKSGYYFLAKTLAKVNFIWLQLFLLAKVLATTNSEPG